ELLEHPQVTCMSVDLTDEQALAPISSFLSSSWERVDVLIHNAGSLVLKPFEQTSVADFESVYKVNVFGVVALTQVCLPFMGKGSHVVTISSMGGIQGSMKFAGLAAYSS